MKADTLRQAIDYVLNLPRTKDYIDKYEAPPHEHAIFQIGAQVVDYRTSIVRVIINFQEKNPSSDPEDAVFELQGTNMSDFRILTMSPANLRP